MRCAQPGLSGRDAVIGSCGSRRAWTDNQHWTRDQLTETSTAVVAAETERQAPQGKLPVLALSALGIVFGDIGTSPLYTFKTILGVTSSPDPGVVLGALSLVLWTLFIITTVKYVSFAMRVDNDGEGGILALMALLGVKKQQRPTIVAVGLFGAALIYGDGAITPAISVLSALEGLKSATPALQPYVVPAAVAILLALFAIQSQGTASDRSPVRSGDAALVRRHRGDGDLRASRSIPPCSQRSTPSMA